MFGGVGPGSDGPYGDVWVLSIPSFKWFRVSGLATTPWAPPRYEAMTCHIVGGGSKMLVYGGRNDVDNQCIDRTGIHVFGMAKLTWEQVYDPNGEEYQVPKEIYDVIGGGPYGGATFLPENGMANSKLEATFRDIIAKNKLTNGTSTNGTITSRPDDISRGSVGKF